MPAPGETSPAVGGAALASYLLFETGFTQELMELGRADVQAKQEEICAFFGWMAPAQQP